MYYISAKTFNEAFGYSRDSIFHFTKIGQKKELIEILSTSIPNKIIVLTINSFDC